MTKIQFGSGSFHFEGWTNTDIDTVDITKPLPFDDGSVDLTFCSHTVEHISAPDVFRFFQECHRILKVGGRMRICVPCISQVVKRITPEYIQWTKEAGFGDGTMRGAVQHLITHHGHLACWDMELLSIAAWTAGFEFVIECQLNQSELPELCGLERHGEIIGERNNYIESIVIEAIK